jgi:signal transduction histidine kinase
MPIVESTFAALPRDPRLEAQVAGHATSAAPAWLWSADGSRILWANAVGAAIFAVEPAACGARRFEPKHPAAVEIVRLAATLPPAGQMRLERLRGFGGSFGRAVTCVCSRVAPDDGGAILVVATEPVGPSLLLRERVSRLFAHTAKPLLAFTPDGKLLYATPPARSRFAAIQSAAALVPTLFGQALATGRASGSTPHGQVTIERLGTDISAVLIADFDAAPTASVAADRVAANKNPGAVKNPDASSSPIAPSTGVETNASGDTHRRDAPASERRQPLRFVWQMDTEGRFVVGSDEFIELMGPRTTAAFGRLWREIAADLKLDPDGQIARAVATRETWSGITVLWPVDDGGARLPVELSGLPVFDRDRLFRGYRGFGVCRDLDRINHLARARRERPIGFMTPPDAAGKEANAIAAEAEHPAAPANAALENAASAAAKEAALVTPEEADAEAPARAEQRVIDVVPAAANVVPFRTGAPPETKVPALSPVERTAFRELAEELTARLQGVREDLVEQGSAPLPVEDQAAANSAPLPVSSEVSAAAPASAAQAVGGQTVVQGMASFAPALLDRLPLGVLVYRHADLGDTFLYANRYLLDLSGCQDLDALIARGGLNRLFAEPAADALAEGGAPQALSIVSRAGLRRPVDGRLVRVPWDGASALALILSNGEAEERRRSHALSLEGAQLEVRELKAYVEAFKKTEAEMRAATREAHKAAAAKAEFVAKISHEIRTPLNAITGFAEVIMGERFGPIGNERYREYLKDIHAAGLHVVSLLNDLLDLSKIETGQLDLSFANVSLNELTQQCVGIMQPQASRARIIIRTSLTPGLPQVVADERSLRQIVLNLLSNSIRFTGPGGQVIVSTAFADSGEAVLRVRDTGVGMSEKDVEAALEPFRQAATSGSWGSGGTGLGLPLTKALAEANRANFSIKSAPNAGTLIEVAFPPTRIAR